MSHILVCATPALGHVNPLIPVASHLKELGHQIVFNTGSVFRDSIEALDIPFVPLTGLANYDYRQLNATFGERQTQQPGSEMIIYDMKAVINSDMEFTFLQPATLFQNVTAAMFTDVAKHRVFPQAWSVDTYSSQVDYRDVAEVAAFGESND
jgi:UDP:flavonoid glycosyltransferase YjiC (YdhE family)